MAKFVQAELYRSSDCYLGEEDKETEEEAIQFAGSIAGCVAFARNTGSNVTQAFGSRGDVQTAEKLGWDPKESGWVWYDKVFDLEELESIKTRRLAALAITEAELDKSLQHEELLEHFRAMQAELRETSVIDGKELLDDSEKSKQANQFQLVEKLVKFCDSRPILDPIFSKGIQADWVNCGGAQWMQTWLNPFECLGKPEASCVPPPQLEDWHDPTYDFYCSEGVKDPAIAAVKACCLEDVRKLFVEPNDLLRWEVDGVDNDHQSLVATALAFQIINGPNLDILDHLLNLSPKYFIQQMSMTSGGCINLAPLGNMLGWIRQEAKVSAVLAVVQWLCRSGVMTDTLFDHCSSKTGWGGEEQTQFPPGNKFGIRAKSWESAADCARKLGADVIGSGDVIAELERWQQMPPAEKRQLTEQRFETLLAPVLPKKMITINFKGEGGQDGYGGQGGCVECYGLDGTHIASISMGSSDGKDSAWLIGQIADAIGMAKGDIRVTTSMGEILQEAPSVLLSTCSL